MRWVLLVPNLVWLVMGLCSFEVLWFFYFFSFWGFLANLISLVASMQSVQKPEVFQQIAVVSTEISFSMNFVISLIFWVSMASCVFKDLDEWTGINIFLRIYVFVLHTLPLASTSINLYLTDITFYKQDWKIVLIVGLSYMIANCIGCVVLGHRLYPGVDWDVPILSIMIFTSISGLMSAVHFGVSHLISKHKTKQRKSKDKALKKADDCI